RDLLSFPTRRSSDLHRKRTRRAPGSDPKKIEYFVGPDRSRIRRAYICTRHEFEGSAQFIVDHQARGRSRLVSRGPALAHRRTFHRHAAGTSTKGLAAKAECGGARPSPRGNYSRAFETLSQT